MEGIITLKIVAAPGTKTQVSIEKTDVKMTFSEMKPFKPVLTYLEETIDKLNGYSEIK